MDEGQGSATPGVGTSMRAFVVLSMLLCAALAGCKENRDPATPEGALHLLRDAVLARDPAALLAQSSSATHKQLEELHKLLQGQAQHIEHDYPAEQRTSAKAAYPAGVLEAADPPALFAVLVTPQLGQLGAPDGVRWGLSALGIPAVDGDHASVSTQAGETLEFVREDGVWHTTAFEQSLQSDLNRARLNQQTLDENLTVFAELTRREAAKAAAAAAAPSSGSAPASAPAPGQSP
jgi:hypothetical protein